MAGEAVQIQTADSLNVINSVEELNKILAGNDNPIEPAPGTEDAPGDKLGEKKKDGTAAAAKKTAPVITDPSDPNYKLPQTLEEKEEGEEDEEEFSNVIEYLNKKHNMGLNVEALPKDLTREQEAELVSEVYEKLQAGAKRAVSQYQNIDKILKDPEVAAFVKAKSEGKTMKDFAMQYAASPEGAPDDILVKNHFKLQYPTLPDAELQEMVEEARTKNRIPKLAEAARAYFKNQETATKAAADAKLASDSEAEEQEYRKATQRLSQLLQATPSVYGVPLEPQMKNSLYRFITERDEDGVTEHDRVLQSENGVILSGIGILLLKDFLKTRGSVEGEKRKKSLADKLFESEGQLQRTAETRQDPEFSAKLANSW